MVSVSHCSFALVCVILLITPFNIIPSAEARQLAVQQKSFASSFSSFNFNALFQKLNDLLTKGFDAVGGNLDLSLGNNALVLYPGGIFISTGSVINKDVMDQVSTCTANILNAAKLNSITGLVLEISQDFSSGSISTTIQPSSAIIFVFNNGIYIKYSLNVNAIAQKISGFFQYIPQLFQKIESLPQCLTKA